MQRGSLSDLTAFIAVADNLSFRTAASRQGITPSALSHSMRQLEARLGVRLLHRTTRSVSLTDAGLRLLDRLRPAFGQIADALETLDQERGRPFGRLRIYATFMASVAVIASVWNRFLTAYPDVYLEVEVGEPSVDIVVKGFDAGIGPIDRAAVDMTAVRVTGPLKLVAVAAPSYLAQRCAPHTPDELIQHSCIQYRQGPLIEWPFERDGKSTRISVNGRVMVNHSHLAVRAAVDGLGIAYTTRCLAEPFLRSGQLLRVLEDWSPSLPGLYLYYPGHRQIPAALRAFIDMARAERIGATVWNCLPSPVLVD